MLCKPWQARLAPSLGHDMADTPRTYKRKKDDVTLLAGRLNVEAVMAAQAQSQENRGYHAGDYVRAACSAIRSAHPN